MWAPVGVVDDLQLAAVMADLLREQETGTEATVVSADDLLHTFPSQDRERILERLNSRSTNDIQRDLALRQAAAARLATPERRSGLDRRSGRERRSGTDWTPASERRSGGERRAGRDRRARTAA